MEEYIDALDEKTGLIIGQSILKSEAHKNGICHGSINILIVNKDKTRTLLQKRSKRKSLYPNTWDIAVGGHISKGENELVCAKRELEEELGLSNYELTFIKKIHEKLNYNNFLNNEYVSIFIICADIDKITLQKEEVSEVKWFSKDELNYYVKNNKVVPHIEVYKILNEILN